MLVEAITHVNKTCCKTAIPEKILKLQEKTVLKDQSGSKEKLYLLNLTRKILMNY